MTVFDTVGMFASHTHHPTLPDLGTQDVAGIGLFPLSEIIRRMTRLGIPDSLHDELSVLVLVYST